MAGLIAVPLLLIVGLVFLREPLCESICSAERAKWERRRSEEIEKCRKSRGVWSCGMAPAVSSPPACDITCKDIVRQQNYFPTYTMLYFGTVIEATLIVYLLEDKFRKKRDWGKAKRIMFYVLTPIIVAAILYGIWYPLGGWYMYMVPFGR